MDITSFLSVAKLAAKFRYFWRGYPCIIRSTKTARIVKLGCEDTNPPIPDVALDRASAEKTATHLTTVQHLFAELEGVAAGIDVARAASFALATVQQHALNKAGLRLSAVDRDRALTALMFASSNIIDCVTARRQGAHSLPAVRAFAASAIEAVCALVVIWSEQNPADSRPREFISELHARARWLRNELHNASLEDSLRRGQSNRAKAVVDDMVSRSLRVTHA